MIIWLLCVWGCALVFDAIGMYAIRRKEPMWFWSGTQVRKEEIADVPAYNRANGMMWIVYSLPYWAAGVLGLYGSSAGAIVLFVGAIGGSLALVAAYNRIYRKYRA